MPYDHFEHRHRFAVWAAASAAQRGLTSSANLIDAIENSGIRAFLENRRSLDTGHRAFERQHRIWCSSIVNFLREDRDIEAASFGRAAKLVAVYLKAMIVNGPYGGSSLARVAHPPIDRLLLQAISRCDEVNSRHKRAWRATAWTQLDEAGYYELMNQLRGVLSDDAPLWMLEEHWIVTTD